MGLGHPNQMKREISESGEECESGNSSLEVNSMVQITLDKGNQVSGIIRWLGYLPQIKHKMAGVELVRSKIFPVVRLCIRTGRSCLLKTFSLWLHILQLVPGL